MTPRRRRSTAARSASATGSRGLRPRARRRPTSAGTPGAPSASAARVGRDHQHRRRARGARAPAANRTGNAASRAANSRGRAARAAAGRTAISGARRSPCRSQNAERPLNLARADARAPAEAARGWPVDPAMTSKARRLMEPSRLLRVLVGAVRPLVALTASLSIVAGVAVTYKIGSRRRCRAASTRSAWARSPRWSTRPARRSSTSAARPAPTSPRSPAAPRCWPA